MTKSGEVYRCNICGNMVTMLHTGKGQLVCCGKPMELLTEKTADDGYEKHVPVIENTPSGVKVTVGSVHHPMTEKHYIEWIEVTGPDDVVHRKFLNPETPPEAEFAGVNGKARARSYCNLHGLWNRDE